MSPLDSPLPLQELVSRMGRARNQATRTYMPAALLAVCDLASQGKVRDGLVQVDDYREAWKRLMLEVQPDREDLWFRPMLHVTKHGLWRPLRGGDEVPDRPRWTSRLNERQAAGVADALRLAPGLAAALSDVRDRAVVCRLVYELLHADGEASSDRLAEVHEHGGEQDLDAELRDLAEYEHRREQREAFEDLRVRRLASSVVRSGQPEFRRSVLAAYSGRCCISGADAPRALQAAHIFPFRGKHTDRVNNGLLLRGDLHILFDDGLLTVEVRRGWRICVHSELKATVYSEFDGRKLKLPSAVENHPDAAALAWHRRKNT